MPCLAQDYHVKLPAAGHYCKSLSSLIRETYAHCHVPCVRIHAGSGWSSGDEGSDDDSVLDDAIETKQVILNEMRNRQMKKRSSYSADSPSPIRLSTTAFAWSYTPLDPRTVLEKMSSPNKCVVVDEENGDGGKEQEQAADGDGDGDGGEFDADDESEAFYSVKSFFTRSTSRAATVASSVGADPPPSLLQSPETWEGFRDCEGWPFGLCRRPAVLPLPPLPSTPAESWKWRKSVSSLAGSPLPAYSTTKLRAALDLAAQHIINQEPRTVRVSNGSC